MGAGENDKPSRASQKGGKKGHQAAKKDLPRIVFEAQPARRASV
jgi:hypothetical protein